VRVSVCVLVRELVHVRGVGMGFFFPRASAWTVCCRVLQCVAVCGRVLQCVAVCYKVLQCATQCVAMCCSV